MRGLINKTLLPDRTLFWQRYAVPLTLILLCAAFFEFLWQGPLRPSDRGDLIAPFTAASRFLHSTNPYRVAHFVEDWHAAGAPASLPLKEGMDIVAYPPSTLLVFSPFTLVPWGTANQPLHTFMYWPVLAADLSTLAPGG